MKKDSELYKKIKLHCCIVGLIAVLTALIVGVFLLHKLEKDEKTTGKYMAQITEKRVRARLDQYIMLSEHLGNYISAGEKLDENTFSELEEKLSRISEKQNETAREITQQAQDDKMAQKSSENPEKEAPEKLIDAVLTEVFS